ncbi:hypothetical protein Nepgr_019171 [Nepenthes gracilis]|uniref:BHLH domain-containing protein n=1 Tax=Nepenthes gracilis TaxID=150966 RepID=A0AAD3ST06_NEPGR|nr:hypothetical protein Nepgr_019171 [Nepenthes gracilis]
MLSRWKSNHLINCCFLLPIDTGGGDGEREREMQSAGGGGGNELNRGGLARFRSAPATWLEASLDDDFSHPLDPPKPGQIQGGLTQLLTAGTITSNPTTTPAAAGNPGRNSTSYIPSADPGFLDTHSNLTFHRQNSSPAEFLSSNIDGYFSSFGIPNYEYLGSSADDSQSCKRFREADSGHPSSKFVPQLKGEQSEQWQAGGNSLLDLEMEKLLEDSVPCRVRAKRGCATHPRSIAERVRRTRISDRIRKLQELVPNMDKQTNTADMLEEAVEYVKRLQKQIQELTEHQKNCKCTAKES